MKRNATEYLINWKMNPQRKPLLFYGARQTGKTHLIKSFGQQHYKQLIYFDLEKQAGARAAFDGDLAPELILKKLSQLVGMTISSKDTLLVLDEIQASNRALASLKYFNEEMKDMHVIGAGSLLGVAVNREDYSAPVGAVNTYTLYPMSFNEFLEALGKESMVEAIRECFITNSPYFLHKQALEYFWTYILTGGMPEAVAEYRDSSDFFEVRQIQSTISDLYVADMAKYATPFETAQIVEVWNSVPAQLAKENRKFQYKTVRSGGRKSRYQGAIAWLLEAGIINKCTHITSGKLPLKQYEDEDTFKVYVGDTGLLSQSNNLPPQILNDEARKDFSLGATVENYVAQALTAQGISLRYWTSAGRAEVDFVIEDSKGNAFPIEVKSSDNTRSKSLAVYREKNDPPFSIRLSTKNFGFENGIKSVPLYAAFCINLLQTNE